MFTIGRIVFVLFFVVCFVAALVYSYSKDAALHQKFYKGSYRVLIGFLIFIAILFAIKYLTRH